MPSCLLSSRLRSAPKWVLGIGLMISGLSFTHGRFAQRAAAQTQTNRALGPTSHPVVLDVVVTDKSGRAVSNLTRNDFTIAEENNRQIIAGFERPDQHRYAITTTSLDGKHGERRDRNVAPAVTILVIDCMNTESSDLGLVREMITKYLRAHAPRLPQPTAVISVTDKQLKLVHDYTEDAAELEQAIEHEDAEFASSRGNGRATVTTADRVGTTVNYLEQIAAANMDFAGRKNVIWIASGFPALDLTSSGGGLRSDGGLERVAKFAATANEIWNARLAIYTIDPRGLQSLAPGSIAPQTGGKTLFSHYDLDVAISNSVADGSDYYTLSYYPTSDNQDGQFRKIKVTLTDPNLTARTRTGYYAAPDTPATEEEIDAELTNAVKNPLTYRGLDVTASYKLERGGPRTARYAIAIDRHGLDWQLTPDGERRCRIMFVTKSIASNDHVERNDIKMLEGKVKENRLDKEMDEPMVFTLIGEFPSEGRVRVMARDVGNGNIGTADLNAGGSVAREDRKR